MWLKISALPHAVWYALTEYVSVGSRKETFGRSGFASLPILSFVSRLEITPPQFISEPVAESVRIVSTGSASFTSAHSLKKSHASWSTLAAAAIHFVQSSVEPPPTASSTSMLCSLQSFAPSLTESTLGLGSMPDSSKTSSPAFSICAITLS